VISTGGVGRPRGQADSAPDVNAEQRDAVGLGTLKRVFARFMTNSRTSGTSSASR